MHTLNHLSIPHPLMHTHLPINLSTYPPIVSICPLYTHSSSHLPICPFICNPPTHLSTYSFIHLPIYQFIHTHSFIYPPPTYPSTHHSTIHPPIHHDLFIYLLSDSLSHPPTIHLSTHYLPTTQSSIIYSVHTCGWAPIMFRMPQQGLGEWNGSAEWASPRRRHSDWTVASVEKNT